MKTAPEGAAREGFGARGDGSYNPVNDRREELPMNEDALRSWFWAAVIVLALAIWVIWGMVVGI